MNPQRRNIIAAVTLVAVLAALRFTFGGKSHRSDKEPDTSELAVPAENIAQADSAVTIIEARDSIAQSKKKKRGETQKKKTTRHPPSRDYLDDPIKRTE